MWPSACPFVQYLGLGCQAILAVLLGQRFAVRPRVQFAISVCYLFGMGLGAKVLSNIRQGMLHDGFVGTAEHFSQGGMWGGALIYLVLAVPFVFLLTRKSPLGHESQSRRHRSGGGRGPVANRRGGDAGQSLSRQANLSNPYRSPEERWLALDLIALTAPIPMAVAKLGCLCGGCCYGKPCDLPWGIVFPAGNPFVPSGVPLHPTQLYDVFALLVVAAVLAWVNRPEWRGMLLLWFVGLFCLGRLVTEFWRAHPGGQTFWGSLTPFQWLCAVTASACAAMLCVYRWRMGGSYPEGCAQKAGQPSEQPARSSGKPECREC